MMVVSRVLRIRLRKYYISKAVKKYDSTPSLNFGRVVERAVSDKDQETYSLLYVFLKLKDAKLADQSAT